MRKFIENEWLVPCLQIGIPEDVFWRKTPKTIQIYFEAYKRKIEEDAKRWSQKMWEMGIWVKNAIQTSVFVAGLYNGKSIPQYPNCPFTEDVEKEKVKDEQWVKNERLRAYNFFKSLGKKK